ncbi:MAG: tryptophan--tRNA ligase [Eubacterium sp.]|nr:tryptophan--tRNA ligase [Eubacterium sp.]
METNEKKKVLLSGIQPTGVFTLGNYIGAVRNWKELQEEYECAYFVADLHSLTVRQDPAELRKHSKEAFALLLACGLDPEQSLLFIQSHVPTHAELGWILSCYTQFGELSRMTQFKDKSSQHPENINAGLFDYPALMAADILLYQPDFVPVGADQKQHIELTRTIVNRFNGIYGDVFRMPEPYIPKNGAKIMSLQNPTKKMSKSDENPNACISILDEPDVIMAKFRRAVTDSDTEVRFAEGKDGINNLMTIYSAFTGLSMEDIEKEFAGKGYGDFKKAVGAVVADGLTPIREEFKRVSNDKAYLEQCYKKGAETATYVSRKTLNKVKKKVGLLPL